MQTFAAAVEETIEHVERALARIEKGDGAEVESTRSAPIS
jgi:hypothetical protein